MNLGEFIDKLTGEYAIDLSSDSPDGWRKLFVVLPDQDRTPHVLAVRIDDDGDIAIEVA